MERSQISNLDKLPVEESISTVKSSPPIKSTAVYKKKPPVFKQVGLAKNYIGTDKRFIKDEKPNYYQLALWDEARRKEPLIKTSLDIIRLSILSKIGDYSHPDKQIQDFITANVANKIHRWLSPMIAQVLWAGFSVSEIVYSKKIYIDGTPQVWLDNLVNYHPIQVELKVDDYGVLNDGAINSNSQYRSGVWVPYPQTAIGSKIVNSSLDVQGSLVRLPKANRVHLTLGADGNPIYGRSLLETVFPYYVRKEAFLDIMMFALDRYATPLTYIIVPPVNTSEEMVEPDGETIRLKTLAEKVAEDVEDLEDQSVLVITQPSKDNPVTLNTLTTGNNFSDSFEKAINICDQNILTGLGVPNLLIKDSSNKLGSSGSSERQIEMFNHLISSLYTQIVDKFCEQAILPLIRWNFDLRYNPLAYNPGRFIQKPFSTTEFKETIEAVKTLHEIKVIDNKDRDSIRSMLPFLNT